MSGCQLWPKAWTARFRQFLANHYNANDLWLGVADPQFRRYLELQQEPTNSARSKWYDLSGRRPSFSL
jgi:hypothetical protein